MASGRCAGKAEGRLPMASHYEDEKEDEIERDDELCRNGLGLAFPAAAFGLGQ